MPTARGPNRGHACAGMPGCCKSAHWWTRAGQSRCRKRHVAIVVIVVAVVVVVVLLSCHSCGHGCGCGRGHVVMPRGSGSGSCCDVVLSRMAVVVVELLWPYFPPFLSDPDSEFESDMPCSRTKMWGILTISPHMSMSLCVIQWICWAGVGWCAWNMRQSICNERCQFSTASRVTWLCKAMYCDLGRVSRTTEMRLNSCALSAKSRFGDSGQRADRMCLASLGCHHEKAHPSL